MKSHTWEEATCRWGQRREHVATSQATEGRPREKQEELGQSPPLKPPKGAWPPRPPALQTSVLGLCGNPRCCSKSGLWKFVVNPGRVNAVCSLFEPSPPFPERLCPQLHLEMRKRSDRQGDPSPGPQELTGGRGRIATQGF